MTVDLEQIEAAIRAEITGLEQESLSATDTRKTVVLDQQSVGRLSRMDAMQQQAMANATETRRRTRIAQLEAALSRLKSDEFGACIDCGETIAPRRISANPTVQKCISCQNG